MISSVDLNNKFIPSSGFEYRQSGKAKLLLASMMIAMLFTRCSDPQLDEIPVYNLTEPHHNPITFPDSLSLDDGLLYRKLSENDYTDIFGLAKFTLPISREAFEYDLILVSCRRGSQKLRLLITIHHRFNAVQDVFAFNARQFELWEIVPEPEDPHAVLTAQLNSRSAGATNGLESIQVLSDGTMQKVTE